MSRVSAILLAAGGLVMATALNGCARVEGEAAAPANSTQAGDSCCGDAATQAATTIDVSAAMAELSPADRAAAEKQKICPVSGQPLGGMGKPYKIQIKDRDVFLCCQGCEEEIKADPGKYLAKLPK